MLKKTVQAITVMIMVLTGLVIDTQVQASVIDATPFVDKISTTTTEYYPRETGEITIDFSGKNNHQFHSGDEMVFQIPAELIGFKQMMWMGDYAQVRVENDRVIVKFTDKIQGRTNIKASIKFGVKGSEKLPRGSKELIPLNLGTTIKDYPMVTVSGYAEDDGQPQQAANFAYKGGRVNDDDVHLMGWYIVVNPNNVTLDEDVVVTDSLGFGHEIVPGSIKLGSETINASHGSLAMDKHSFKLVLNKNYVSNRGVGIYYQTRLTTRGEKFKTLLNNFSVEFQISNQPKSHLDGSAKVNNVMMSGSIDGEYEQLHANVVEENNVDEQDTLGEVESIVTDTATETTTPNNVNGKAEVKQPEVHVGVTEENNVDEQETLGEVEPIVTDSAIETTTPNNVNGKAEVKQPEVHVGVTEENNVDEQDTLGEVESIVTDTATETTTPNNVNGKAEVKQPEVHVGVTEENNVDEQDTLGEVESIVTDTATETTTPNNVNDKAEVKQPEVHVGVTEENNVDEQDTLGEVESIVTDTATETTTPNNMNGKAEVKQPEVRVNAVEENMPEQQEVLGLLEEIVFETATESVESAHVIESTELLKKTETVEVSQPEVNVMPLELVEELEDVKMLEFEVTPIEGATEVIEKVKLFDSVVKEQPHIGIFSEGNRKDAPDNVVSVDPKQPGIVKGHQDSQDTTVKTERMMTIQGETLPETGSKGNYLLMILGVMLMCGLILVRPIFFK